MFIGYIPDSAIGQFLVVAPTPSCHLVIPDGKYNLNSNRYYRNSNYILNAGTELIKLAQKNMQEDATLQGYIEA